MRIGIAQIEPRKGALDHNIQQHLKWAELAASHGADSIVFPELSITGYEPELAEELAIEINDERFDVFQNLSNEKKLIIGVGVPTKHASGTHISMVVFQPEEKRKIYSKKYLHADEEPFFVPGEGTLLFIGKEPKAALAICYEISVPEHAQNAFDSGAKIYLASVAKSSAGVQKAEATLSDIARRYSVPVLMSNAIGYCDNFEAGGKSAIWNNKGALIAQLDDRNEGLLIYDTEMDSVLQKSIE